MTVRPLVILLLGLGGLSLLFSTESGVPVLTPTEAAPLLVLGALLWAVAIGYTIWRAPHRFEADAAYRRRIKYRD